MSQSTPELKMNRRNAIRMTLATGAALLQAPSVMAQGDWLNKPVTLVVDYPPGGQTDFIARLLVTNMQSSLGQPVIIENKPGANGSIASDVVLKARSDGYQLLAGNVAMTIAPHVYQKAKMPDPLKFTPIGTMLTSGLVLLVPAASPAEDFAQFVQMVKDNKKGIKSTRTSASTALRTCRLPSSSGPMQR